MCPQCPARAAQRWLDARQADLLPVEYYHVVFTLSAEIGAIAYANKAAIYRLLFDAAVETLLTIAADAKHLGAQIGATLVLHTWGSALTHHPHVHGIVPGGGLSPDGQRWVSDAQMLTLIRAIHAEFKGAYGSPRMAEEIRDWGFPASKERVERLMRENAIRARHKRRFKATTDSKHSLPVAPNQVWRADLTYIWTTEGCLYLAVVLDLFNREVVGWSLKPRMTADIAIDALTMA